MQLQRLDGKKWDWRILFIHIHDYLSNTLRASEKRNTSDEKESEAEKMEIARNKQMPNIFALMQAHGRQVKIQTVYTLKIIINVHQY